MKKLVALVALLLSLLACSPAAAAKDDRVDPDIVDGTAARELAQAREKWLGWGVSDYRMKLTRSCYCATPRAATITVRGGKAVKVSARPWYGPRTVPAMFRVVSQAIKRKAARLEVRYDGRLGFPKRVSIDHAALMADDEISYRITRFKQL